MRCRSIAVLVVSAVMCATIARAQQQRDSPSVATSAAGAIHGQIYGVTFQAQERVEAFSYIELIVNY